MFELVHHLTAAKVGRVAPFQYSGVTPGMLVLFTDTIWSDRRFRHMIVRSLDIVVELELRPACAPTTAHVRPTLPTSENH